MILDVCKEEKINKFQNINDKPNSLELKKIKELIDIEDIEYISDNVKNILKITKENSKKSFTFEKRIERTKGIYRVILYIRLSEEDGDLIDGDISKSIRNQLLLLLDECKKRNWKVVGIFCEEDISGVDDNRTEWRKSLKFCECRRTDIMLCKSQSRFSRSMEMIEKYLHKEFVDWGIRFVGIVDNTDTSIKGNKKARQINGLVNEWQIEDQSINTRDVLKKKKSLGLYATAWTPYGYIKNPKDKYQLIIDKEASIIVKRIFEYHMNGWGCSKIAKELNKDRVPTTWEHMKEIGLKISNRNPAKIVRYQTETNETLQIIADKFYLNPKDIIEYNNVLDDFFIENDKKIEERVLKEGIIISIKTRPVWNENSVRNILKNEAYTGYLVLGKYQNKSYKDKTRIRVPEEQWIRVPNCYEPIIDRKTWLIVNNKIDANKEKYNSRSKPQSDGTIPLFSKKVYCECCKSSFSVSTRIKDEKDNYYMRCRGSKKDKGRYAICDNTKTLKKSELENIVLEEINKQIKKYYDLSKVEKNYYDKKINNELNEEISVLEKERNNASNEINKKTNLINLLYEDRANGIISIDEFIILKNSNSRYIELAKERIAKIEEKIFELKKKRDIEIKSKELFSKYKKIKKLDRTIINEFVEKIYIGKYDKETDERNIKIFWNIKES